MRIGLIGTNWGRVHCGTFKKCGYSIDTVMGVDEEKTRNVAMEEQIPNYTTDANDLKNMDVVIIASPMETHLQYIEMFQDKWVFCEKPLAGQPISKKIIDKLKDKNIFVNFPFPYLQTAKQIKKVVDEGRIGEIFSINLNIAVSLPFTYSDIEWFLSIAAHELYFFNHIFAPFKLENYYSAKERLSIATIFTNNAQVLSLNLNRAYRESLMLEMKIVGSAGELNVSGGYLPGKMWNFEPILVNGEKINDGEYSIDEDVWVKANATNVKMFLDVMNGVTSRESALMNGLADLLKASVIENSLEVFLNTPVYKKTKRHYYYQERDKQLS